MNLNYIIAMRQEIFLLILILVLIVGEIFIDNNNKAKIVHLATLFFGIHTILGLFPIEDASLFGGMFHTNKLIHFFKSLLNIGVLILLLQSADWIQEKLVTENKAIEYFKLIFSSLLGMYFMISSGDFLMFYLGLELSTFPVAALVAWETSKRISSEAGVKFILSARLASGVSLFGISLFYAATGSNYFADVTGVLVSNNLSILASILFFSGLAFKTSLVPFHF
jgi:NADH-quinone oxidoreductase subunit N